MLQHEFPQLAAASNVFAPGVHLVKLETYFLSPFSRALDRVLFLTQQEKVLENQFPFFSR